MLFLAGPSALLWDPSRREAKPLPNLPVEDLSDLSVEVLADDRVILGGGPPGGAAELFVLDVRKDAWSPAPSLPQPRSRYRLTGLKDGRVLLTGGGSLGWQSTGAKASGIFLGVLGAALLLGAIVMVARAGGRGSRWIGFFAGVAIPVIVTAVSYWITAVIAGAIRG